MLVVIFSASDSKYLKAITAAAIAVAIKNIGLVNKALPSPPNAAPNEDRPLVASLNVSPFTDAEIPFIALAAPLKSPPFNLS